MKPILIDLTEKADPNDKVLPELLKAVLCLALLGEVALGFYFILAWRGTR